MEIFATIPLSSIKKIEIYSNTKRLYMSQIKAQTGADYIINGGIYSFSTFKPFGNVKIDGKIAYAPGYKEYGFAWNTGNDIKYTLLPADTKNYIGCVGMIKDGAAQKMTYNKDMGGSRPRSAIGITESAVVLYACNGASCKTPEALQKYGINRGWRGAIMLDGGGSTQASTPNATLNSSENGSKGRIVQNYILIYTHEPSVTCPYTEPSVTIKQGSIGTGAKWVQWWLNKKNNAGLAVDGIFGKNSVAALMAFQEKANLEVDGICGAMTRAALKR